ncbi:MAG: hypothetical protein IT457_15575 [Planctomycetes bacterium]|nr:hypothetical protein [Planctomycetota bacterium]
MTLHDRMLVMGARSLERGRMSILPRFHVMAEALAGRLGKTCSLGGFEESSMHAAVVAAATAVADQLAMALTGLDGGSWRAGAIGELAKCAKPLDATDRAILRALGNGAKVAKEIASSVRVNDATVRGRIGALRKLGLVEGKKPYRLTEAGKAELSAADG